MSKTYRFAFPGTREQFSERLDQYPSVSRGSYYFDGYIVKASDRTYRFGVQRCGHSGGYWFEPEIIESEGKLVFCGKIVSEEDGGKPMSKIEEALLYVLLSPLILLAAAYYSVARLIAKIRHKPWKKDETPEDRLYDLMENRLNCTRME